MSKYVFFWGESPFSQWSKSIFTYGGVVYTSTEQFMMNQKALLFGDHESSKKIMSTDNPREQKALGRKVQNFDVHEWDSKARDIVFNGNYAKFSQNEKMKKQLLNTGDKILVEASPYDKIWGVGMDVYHPDIEDETRWKGKNWLGQVLMAVRNGIKNNDKTIPVWD